MSAMMQPYTHETFPAQFVLYMPSRSSSRDPYSGFALMNSTMVNVTGGTSYRQLTLAPLPAPILEFEKNPFNDLTCYPGAARWLNFKGDGGDLPKYVPASHRARQWSIPVHFAGAPVLVPVIEITNVNKCFVKMIKRNVTFRLSATAAAVAAASAAAAAAEAAAFGIAPGAPGSIAIASLATPSAVAPATNVIAHVATTPASVKPLKKKKLVSAAPTPGDLCLHVARQLLELAQIKKEMCPVIAEEYINGETAVMPCGHLFSKLAIQESFKKENNKCPACRQIGRPTYV